MKKTKGKHAKRPVKVLKMMNAEMCRRGVPMVSKPSGEEHET